ncbi:RNA polymerase sigma factor [Flavihumibacter sp. UBA7668]|uniref:RNA polymerase sigma factor n=1 Tax=Flavihumibacter sp. UBA7668 TaxID=1946542 RepID=UPI0025BE5CFB|nr:sigma-70 family RNA polymerase sigma factor [Flavihumibacter sp. UBA7668]
MLSCLSDKDLLLSDKEESAFRVLYNRYWELLYRKAYSRLGNRSDAEDITQEIFITVWRNRQSINPEPTLAPYLLTAVKYAIIKKVYREAKKGVTVALSISELEHTGITEEDILHYRELQGALSKEIATLPDRMQQIYRLNRMDHLQVAEIATRLNLSEQTVRNTLSIAVKRLREKLSDFSAASFFL